MRMLRPIYFLFVLFFCEISFSQINTQYIKNISSEDGLHGTTITCIMQDSKGFMWFGTNEGVEKYDGTKFTHYYRDLIKPELPTNSASHIFEDNKQNIWICTNFGISKYNPRADKFKQYLYDTISGSISNQLITYGIQDSEGEFWFFAWDKINLLTPEGFIAIENSGFDFHRGGHLGFVADVIELPERKLLLSTFFYGLIIFDISTSTFSRFSENYTVDRTRELLLRDEKIFIGSWSDGLLVFDINGNLLKKYDTSYKDSLNGNKLVRSFDFCDGKFYLATNNGLKILDENTGEIKHYLPYAPGTKIKKINTQLMFDNNNGLWIGSIEDRLSYLHHSFHLFSHYEASFKDYLKGDRGLTQSVYLMDNGSLVFRADNKLYLLKSFESDPERIRLPFPESDFYFIKDNYDKIWLGNKEKIYELIIKDDNVSFKYSFNHIGSFGQVWVDKKGCKWIGEYHTISCYNKDNQLIKKYDRKDGLFDAQNACAFEFKDGTIGLTSSNVIYKQNIQNDSFSPLYYKNGFNFCDYDKDNRVFFISNEGIFIYDNDTLINYTTSHGLPSNSIMNLNIDDNNIAWITTSNGLSRFDIDNKSFKNFSIVDGLMTNQFLTGMDLHNNTMILSHTKGFTKFNINEIKDIPSDGKIIFTDMLVHNKPVRIEDKKSKEEFVMHEHISFSEKVEVPSKYNVLTFKYSLLDFYAVEKHIYEYYLEGFDKEWTYAGHNNFVTYTNLAPGKYTLNIRAYNGDGVLSSQQAKLDLVILPFWYQTLLFRIMLIVVITMLIIGVYWVRVNRLKKRQIILEKQVKERTAEIHLQKEEISTQADNLLEINKLLKERQEEVELQTEVLSNLNATKDKFFSIIAHDLKNPFQGILGFTDILMRDFIKLDDAKKLEIIEMIQGTSKGAFALLENLLQWARSQTQSVEFVPTAIDIKQLVFDTFDVLKLNAGNKKVALVPNISGTLVAFADKNMILTVIRNLVNNAIKYTPQNGEVTIKAWSEEELAIIQVTDTGYGMSKDILSKLFHIDKVVSKQGTEGESGTGLGLIICKEFVEKNQGSISVESLVNKGSVFTIKLPISKNTMVEEVNLKPTSISDIGIENDLLEVSDQEKKIALIVDDDQNLRFSIKNYLTREYHIYEAENGKDGINKAIELLPDIVISDVMMPEMDGIEMSKVLKDDQRTSHIPIVLLTARISEDHMLEGLQTGADDYINKPVSLKVLEVKVRNLIAIRQKLREGFSLVLPVSKLKIENQKDKEFLEKLSTFIENNIASDKLNFESIAQEIGMSKTQLYRKLKALTNQTVNEYVRVYRLKKSLEYLLANPDKNISEAAYQHGFSDPKYFSKSFKELFGKSPSEYLGK